MIQPYNKELKFRRQAAFGGYRHCCCTTAAYYKPLLLLAEQFHSAARYPASAFAG